MDSGLEIRSAFKHLAEKVNKFIYLPLAAILCTNMYQLFVGILVSIKSILEKYGQRTVLESSKDSKNIEKQFERGL